ncbi:Gfo/Idh/MocA family protein [Candidatus Pantoea multigeneris]|uniref:Gfo/Idh/MocA family oxidoreductase n=1 Tax=Candidatus Pantoea multigeneris TaxID=2608357 RepID=A0ABX0RGC3_9GAMM|nr:Gfo/Idh/MocA family oxidoreductase [Pantoea multigeneris]NIF22300.1 Gfo/Idh/MocA family oxidoreductase [Pantoea multigeneris]
MPEVQKKLRVGVLGCGPISQAGHFEACTKACNAELYAICDSADDLRERMSAMWAPQKAYADYQQMLDDEHVDAVIIATADAFHVQLAIMALRAGKHVLCEKPLGVTVEECEELLQISRSTRRVFQIGHMKRFDGGIQSAREFIQQEMGELVAYKGWYCDNSHRYTVTDAVQPQIVKSLSRRKPAIDPKADLQQYYLLAHGSHLIDTAMFLAGEITEIEARFLHRGGVHCWYMDVAFANGTLGHLDLSVGVRMDWHEGFQIYGENGSILGKTFNPWLYKSSEVDIFHEKTASWSRALAADGQFYRRQLESFANAVLSESEVAGTGIEEGLLIVKAMAAIQASVRTGKSVQVAAAKGAI